MLVMNTLAFTVCFAAWMLNGVLVTFLTVNQVFNWTATQSGWLLGIPVLSGSLFRLPAGMLTDKYGGKPVMTATLILCAIPMYLLSTVDSFLGFALCSFGFGLVGISFAIGIAYTSVWFPQSKQGLALGIFGVGNAGSALTALVGSLPRAVNFTFVAFEIASAELREPVRFVRLAATCRLSGHSANGGADPRSPRSLRDGFMLARVAALRVGAPSIPHG